MIYNERQYRITSQQIENLSGALQSIDEADSEDWLKLAQHDAIAGQVSDLKAQISEYLLIKEGKIKHSEVSDLSSLPKTLIQARIAKGLSQKDLGDILGMKEQQIQRYEASNYMGASLARLIEISNALDIRVSESWAGSNAESEDIIFSWDSLDSINWNLFPLKEMIQKDWLEINHGEHPAEAVKNYFITAAGPQYASALHRKKFHGGHKPNEYSLLAWQARVLEKARLEHDKGNISEFEYNDSWVKELASISIEENAPLCAQEFLSKKGIILIFEEHLKGTYLDGAAMLLETGNPIVGLTLRYDRLDNFWFVLLHELGHVFHHLLDSLNMDFFDDKDDTENDTIEREADAFALDALIPVEQWKTCLSRFAMTEQAVIADAQRLGIHPSILAGRIRNERQNYTVLNNLVRNGAVRELLGGSNED